MKLGNNDHCFVCGTKNPGGLKLSFRYSDGKITSEFTPSREHQGYPGITHGGIISAVLDEAMIQVAIAEGINPVTAELRVRFRKTLETGRKAVVEAGMTRKSPRLFEAHSRLLDAGDGEVIAEATAKLI
ncbi:MAG TPA: PaaI family thioesterase [Dissulfurispiraceae bacterium]